MYFAGYKVILTDGGVLCPRRTHSRRKNQGKLSYHRRIQKKWLKRFGQEWIESQPRGTVLKIADSALVIRREDWAELAQEMKKQGPSPLSMPSFML